MGSSENRRSKAYHDNIYSEAPYATFLQILGKLITQISSNLSFFFDLFKSNKIVGRFGNFGGGCGFSLNIDTQFHLSLCQ